MKQDRLGIKTKDQRLFVVAESSLKNHKLEAPNIKRHKKASKETSSMAVSKVSSKTAPAAKAGGKGSSGGGGSERKSPLKNARLQFGKGKTYNEVYWFTTRAGIMVVLAKKAGKNESVYLQPSIRMYHDLTDEEANATGIIAVLDRKGVDGNTAMPCACGSIYNWSIFVISMEENDGPRERRAAAQRAVDFLNTTLVDSPQSSYQWRQKPLKLVADRTATPAVAVDQVLLTQDLLCLLDEAHPSMTRGEMAEMAEDELRKWFSDVVVGRSLLLGGEE